MKNRNDFFTISLVSLIFSVIIFGILNYLEIILSYPACFIIGFAIGMIVVIMFNVIKNKKIL
jgi:hypothetical protein